MATGRMIDSVRGTKVSNKVGDFLVHRIVLGKDCNCS